MLREEVVKTFEGKNSVVVWQPRLEHWYRVNSVLGLIPEKYRNFSLTQLYSHLGASVRYYFGKGTTSPEDYILCEYNGGVYVEEKQEDAFVDVFIHSPKGTLRSRKRLGEWGCSWHYVEYPIKKLEDLEVMEYVLAHTMYRFNQALYEEGEAEIGSLGGFSSVGAGRLSRSCSLSMRALKIPLSCSMTTRRGCKSISRGLKRVKMPFLRCLLRVR